HISKKENYRKENSENVQQYYPKNNSSMISHADNDRKEASKTPASTKTPEQQMAEFEKIKSKLEVFKKAALKKYGFTIALSLLPGQAAGIFEEDESIPKEVAESKPFYLMIVIPEEQYKNIPKIKPELIKMAKETGENLWIFIKTPVDLWNYGLDSKFEM